MHLIPLFLFDNDIKLFANGKKMRQAKVFRQTTIISSWKMDGTTGKEKIFSTFLHFLHSNILYLYLSQTKGLIFILYTGLQRIKQPNISTLTQAFCSKIKRDWRNHRWLQRFTSTIQYVTSVIFYLQKLYRKVY